MSDEALLAAMTGLNERLDRIEAQLQQTPNPSESNALTPEQMETLDWLMNGLGNFKERAPVFMDAASSVANNTLHGAVEAGVDPVGTGVRAVAGVYITRS